MSIERKDVIVDIVNIGKQRSMIMTHINTNTVVKKAIIVTQHITQLELLTELGEILTRHDREEALYKAKAAIATLEHLGYKHHGGERWKPPIKIDADDVTELEATNAELVKALENIKRHLLEANPHCGRIYLFGRISNAFEIADKALASARGE